MTGQERLTISVVVPIFPGARFLAEALDSILAQSLPPDEVIAAGGGADDERAVAERYGGRVRWLGQPAANPAAARNLGLQAARGDLLAFLDPDDFWRPEKLARQAARFAARPDLHLCLTHLETVWTEPEQAERYRASPRAEPIPGYTASTLLARRQAFEQIGPFDQAYFVSDETSWFMRAAEAGLLFDLLPEALVYRRAPRARPDGPAAAERDELLEIVQAALTRRGSSGRQQG
jgi:glycosyltransferase involved in cell wall biosynthesis